MPVYIYLVNIVMFPIQRWESSRKSKRHSICLVNDVFDGYMIWWLHMSASNAHPISGLPWQRQSTEWQSRWQLRKWKIYNTYSCSFGHQTWITEIIQHILLSIQRQKKKKKICWYPFFFFFCVCLSTSNIIITSTWWMCACVCRGCTSVECMIFIIIIFFFLPFNMCIFDVCHSCIRFVWYCRRGSFGRINRLNTRQNGSQMHTKHTYIQYMCSYNK